MVVAVSSGYVGRTDVIDVHSKPVTVLAENHLGIRRLITSDLDSEWKLEDSFANSFAKLAFYTAIVGGITV